MTYDGVGICRLNWMYDSVVDCVTLIIIVIVDAYTHMHVRLLTTRILCCESLRKTARAKQIYATPVVSENNFTYIWSREGVVDPH